jgi:hypothetical protein
LDAEACETRISLKTLVYQKGVDYIRRLVAPVQAIIIEGN